MTGEDFRNGAIRIEGVAGSLISDNLRRALAIARDTHRPVIYDANGERHIVTENGYFETTPITGTTMSKAIAKVWIFASSSGSGTYETIRYSDGSTSCACRGWCQRVAPDGSRSCKHTRSVDMGNADFEALSFHEYGQIIPGPRTISSHTPKPQQPTRKDNHAKKKGSPSPAGYGQRKIIL